MKGALLRGVAVFTATVMLCAGLVWSGDLAFVSRMYRAKVETVPMVPNKAKAISTLPTPPASLRRFNPVAAMWTVDDCPDGDNHQVRMPLQGTLGNFIRVFSRHHLAAGQVVFFMTGVCYRRHPDLVRRIHQSGYLIGNHTYSHANLKLAPDPGAEIDGGPHESRYFRPPYGAHNDRIDAMIARRGLVLLQWDLTGADSGLGGLANSCDQILQSLLRIRPIPGRLPVVDLHMYNPLSPFAVDAYLSGDPRCGMAGSLVPIHGLIA